MRAGSSPWRRLWARCEEPLLVVVVAVLVVLILAGECDRREQARWLSGYRAGAEATGQPARWGTCWRAGRTFPCARLANGDLIEVRMP